MKKDLNLCRRKYIRTALRNFEPRSNDEDSISTGNQMLQMDMPLV